MAEYPQQPVNSTTPLPSGAAQDRTQANSPNSTRLTDGTTFYKATTPSDIQPVSLQNSVPSGSNNIGSVNVSNLPVAFNAGVTNATTQRTITASDSPEITILSSLNTKIPTSPSQDRTTAVAPNAVRLTDGTNFYQGLTEGTDANGVTLPTGGTGARGWLSGIYQRLALAIGLAGDIVANADTGSFNLNQLFQRLLSRITALIPANLTVTSNRLLVDIGSTLSAAVTGVYNATSPTLTNGQTAPLQLSQRANLLIDTIDYVSTPTNISVPDTSTTTSTGQDNQTLIRGNPTNNSSVSFSCSGNSSFALLIENQPAGTPFVGTLQIERTLDSNDTIWTPVGAFVAGSSLNRSQISAECALHGNCSSSFKIRVRIISATFTGTARLTFIAGQGTGTITIGNGIRLFDNTSNAFFAIKAAAVAAAASDTAIVVTQRPFISATVLSLSTSTTGANFQAFGSQSCTRLDILNFSGIDIEYRRGATGNTIKIPNNSSRLIVAIANASEISVRRVDQSNTQVTIQAEAIAT